VVGCSQRQDMDPGEVLKVEQGQALTHADVERIIQLAEEGGFSYVRLESDGVEVTLVRDGYAPPEAAPSAPVAVSGQAAAPVPAAVPVPPAAVAPVPAAAPPVVERVAAPVGAGVVVAAPMIGIVYLAPNPTAEPYVQLGQSVQPGETVALIEVMKMFTPVQAEVAGVVAEVLVSNGEQVDRGQPLFRLEG
jgi:acetyl-CoA carboxylase biotin carboxyl carrier protein